MSKSVLAGILGGLTIASGMLFYMIYRRDLRENKNYESTTTDSNTNIVSTEKSFPLEEIDEPKKEIEEKFVKKKRSSTNKNLQKTKSITKRNRN